MSHEPDRACDHGLPARVRQVNVELHLHQLSRLNWGRVRGRRVHANKRRRIARAESPATCFNR